MNHDADFDWLRALEYGLISEGQPRENWRGVSDQVGFLHERPGGRCLGFSVHRFSEFDVEAPEHAELWEGPRFDAPLLGLHGACAAEVVVASKAFFAGASSLNRVLFDEACREKGEEALRLWQACLETGDMMAHFALGYTHYELGNFTRAYTHLRRYVEICPLQSWNWCWLGKAAEAIGEREEARRAYERAIELEESDEETDARELLDALKSG